MANSTPPPPQDSSAATPLIRPEALQAKRAHLLGTVTLITRLPTVAICLISALIGASILAFLYYGSYTRRATVSGHLQPSTGVIRIAAPQTGIVLEKKAVEGQAVNKDDVLFVLSSERAAPAGMASGGLQRGISEQIAQRQQSLQAEINRLQQTQSQEASYLQRRQSTLIAEAQTIETLMTQQRQRVGAAEDTRQRYQGLVEKDYIAREQLTQKQSELSEQQSRLQSLQRDLITNQREQASTAREINGLANRFSAQIAQIERGISGGKQELAEVQTRANVVITAPAAGVATLVTTELGQTVEPGKALMSIVPKDTPLQARLYVPSRHIGFVRVGDQVLLRYAAYPYQMFGQRTGRVSAISSGTASSQELSALGGPELLGSESAYVIQVSLSEQSILAAGQTRALQPGMRLEADLLQEKRKLWQWMLEPLYSLTKKAAP